MKKDNLYLNRLAVLLVCIFLAVSSCSGTPDIAGKFAALPLGTSVSVECTAEQLNEIKEAGFDYIEFYVNVLRASTYDERLEAFAGIRSRTEEAGISVWSVHLPYGRVWDVSEPDEEKRRDCVARFGEFIALCEEFPGAKLILHASFEPYPEHEREVRLAQAKKSVGELALLAEANGSLLCVEDLPRTCIGNTSDEILYLIDGMPDNVAVCFDTNHLLQETPQQFAARTSPYIRTVHISDYDFVDEKHWMPGQGSIDWGAVAYELTAGGYDGVFMFEVNEDAHESYAHLAASRDLVLEKLKEEIINRERK